MVSRQLRIAIRSFLCTYSKKNKNTGTYCILRDTLKTCRTFRIIFFLSLIALFFCPKHRVRGIMINYSYLRFLFPSEDVGNVNDDSHVGPLNHISREITVREKRRDRLIERRSVYDAHYYSAISLIPHGRERE